MKKKAARSKKVAVARATAGAVVENGFGEVLGLIQTARQRAFQAVNMELVSLYWQIGEFIS